MKKKLTPQERKLLKQEKKLAKKLALANKKRQIKRDYLERERIYGQKSRKELEKIWKKIVTDLKLPDLQMEFEYAVNNMELMIDIKDFEISYLLDELDSIENAYRLNFSTHVENISRIYKIYDARLDELRKNHMEHFNILKRETDSEKYNLKTTIESHQDHLKIMSFHLEDNTKEEEKAHLSEKYFRIRNKLSMSKQGIQILTSNVEQRCDNIWNMCKHYLETHFKHEADVNEVCLPLWDHINKTYDIIKEQSLQILQLHKGVVTIQDRQRNKKEDLDRYFEYRTGERDFFHLEHDILTSDYDTERKHDDKKLKFLVLVSNACLKKLDEQAKSSEAVMKMYSFINKLETQYEQILPFPQVEPAATEKYEAQHKVRKQTIKRLMPFWLKCAQIDITRISIIEEREKLRNENAYLKKILKKYCAVTKYCTLRRPHNG